MRRNHRNKNKINLKDKQIKKILELIAFLLIIIIFICLIKNFINNWDISKFNIRRQSNFKWD